MRDALRTQVGIEDAKVNIQSNWVIAVVPTDHAIPLERIDEAVSRAGYKPVDLSIAATGIFERAESRTLFRISGWPGAYEVTNVPDPPPGERKIEAAVATEAGVARLTVTEGL